MAKRVTLLTSGQPSINPRLVKEADVLADAGYTVTVIYQYWNDCATRLDEGLLSGKQWKAIRVGGSPQKQKFTYLVTRIVQKAGKLLARYIGFNYGIAELSIGRCTGLLYREAVKQPAGLYIAHNLAALPVAVKAAKKNKAKCGFDAEDFHRNEVSDEPNDFDVRLKSCIENKYFTKIAYLSTASPLISKAYQSLYPTLKPHTLLNVFPKAMLQSMDHKIHIEPLKLFWFSQTIGINRGIEEIIKAMGKIEGQKLELHLLGSHNQQIIDKFSCLAKTNEVNLNSIKYYKPILPERIFKFASQFDIGLAIETGIPYNRNICLTNKIFTYLNAGLAVIASDTLAQSDFFQLYPTAGSICKKGNANSVAGAIRFYLENPTKLTEAKQASYLLGQNVLNWENESKKFLRIVEEMI